MPRINLTISTSYVPNWGVIEGVREIFQNAIDGNTTGFPMGYSFKNGTLKIWNDGALLVKSSLLLGETTKATDNKQIGQFGEGYKLGILALLRAGKEVRIFNPRSQENWLPSLREHDQLKTKVVSFEIKESSSKDTRLLFEVKGITEEEWSKIREQFLFLCTLRISDQYHTSYGKVLVGDEVRGKIFVKGIFISDHRDFSYGYDFNPDTVEIDRDRKMVSGWSLENYASRMWHELALSNNPSHFDEMVRLLRIDAKDVGSYRYICNKDTTQKVVEAFLKIEGEDAFPVIDNGNVDQLRTLGKKPIKVSSSFFETLRGHFNLSALQEEFSKSIKIVHEELDSLEIDNLNKARMIVEKLSDVAANLKVVTFGDAAIGGVADIDKRSIMVARWVLADYFDTLKVLIHEYAHLYGHADCTREHTSMVETLWSKVTKELTLVPVPEGGRKVVF